MADPNWMIYGATGYSGALIAEEAVRRGHHPLLAGRSEARLKPLAERLGLDYAAIRLDEGGRLAQRLKRARLVLHCAGPFSQTSAPMLRACLTAGAHYLDITGEIPVFENIFAYDSAARQRGIALIPGSGFDVIPTDCLAAFVAGKVQDAIDLEIAFNTRSFQRPSAGTGKTALEILAHGGLERRNGKLAVLPLGQGGKWVRFSHGERYAVPVPWPDLVTAYHHTHIPNITVYMALRPEQAVTLRLFSMPLLLLLNIGPIRRLAQALAGRSGQGPDRRQREAGRSAIWAHAMDAKGQAAEAWLDTLEGYQFTAVASVRAVEKVLAGGIQGALTPAQAFGADFVLEIEGTRRVDTLE